MYVRDISKADKPLVASRLQREEQAITNQQAMQGAHHTKSSIDATKKKKYSVLTPLGATHTPKARLVP